ncbi:FtsJ-like methyltransferase-domain-containing protein [Obelidium mucronatum]|nr:FtsJ-like methyltransferase-domain-containing protein [Obelidium mucronatum]
MSLYSTDAKFLATAAVSPVPPPRMDPPAVFNARGRGGFGRRGGHRDNSNRDSNRDRDRDNRDRLRFEPYAHSSRDARGDRDSDEKRHAERRVDIATRQSVDWLDNSGGTEAAPGIEAQLKKAALPNYDLFCYAALITRLSQKRTSLSQQLDPSAFSSARNATNPFTLVTDSQQLFINRAAIKIANMDAMASFVNRLVENSRSWRSEPVFADLCSGPGGFSEYILYRIRKRHPNCSPKGYGITLRRGDLDFNAGFVQRERATFFPLYGKDGSGDLTRLENLDSFCDQVLGTNQDSRKVGLVTADGAFSCAGDELYQEDQVKVVLLAQLTTMFRILEKGGDFVMKTFELLTPFSVGLVYLLHKSFRKISVVKPFSSRPANSERYIICQDLFNPPSVEAIQNLRECLGTLAGIRQPPPSSNNQISSSHTEPPGGFISLQERVALGLFDVYSILDIECTVLKDEKFMDWIKESNVKITMRQTEALAKMEVYGSGNREAAVSLDTQQDVMKQCWREWDLV